MMLIRMSRFQLHTNCQINLGKHIGRNEIGMKRTGLCQETNGPERNETVKKLSAKLILQSYINRNACVSKLI